MIASRLRLLDLGLLALWPLCLGLEGVARGVALLAVASAWIAFSGRPKRERWSVAVGLAVALAGLPWAMREAVAGALSAADERRLVAGWEGTWEELDRGSEAAARSVAPALDAEALRRAFAELSAASERRGAPLGLLLIDPDGAIVAWAGELPVHTIEAPGLPGAEWAVRTSYGAVTLLRLAALETAASSPGWRLAATRSLATDRLAFLPAGDPLRPAWRWGIEPAPPAVARTARRFETAGRPGFWVAPAPGAASAVAASPLDLAALGLALAFFALAVQRGIAAAVRRGTLAAIAAPPSEPLAALAFALGLAAVGLGFSSLLGLALGVATAALGAALGAVRRGPPVMARAVATLGGPAALATAWLAQQSVGPLDLTGAAWPLPRSALLLLLVALAAATAWFWAARAGEEHRFGGAAFAVAVALLVAGGLLAERWVLCALLLALVGPLAAQALAQALERGWVATLVAGVVLTGLASGAAWESARFLRLRSQIAPALDRLEPPTAAALDSFAAEINDRFDGLDLEGLGPGGEAAPEPLDLAATLWSRSPLAREDALSALAVLRPGSRPSLFAFGLPVDASGALDRDPGRWAEIALPGWDDRLISGESALERGGEAAWRVRWWLAPRPGFAAEARPIHDLAPALLRGAPLAARSDAQALAPPLRFALFDGDGRPVRTPWAEEAPRREALLALRESEARLVTPDGPVWGRVRAIAGGLTLVYFPGLTVGRAVERLAEHLSALALWLLALSVAGLVVALPRQAARRVVVQLLRSYSRRLLLVFSAVVLLPLLALWGTLGGVLAQQLSRERTAAAEAALNAAQRVVGEYFLSLEPGFSLDAAIDDRLLRWLARVVQHEVHLYWGSAIYASSQRELVSAGLLPRRMPGEVYARLALLGDQRASRIRATGGLAFRELYAPLRIPGVSPGRDRLFLSLPLLAQEEELAAELAELRQRTLLVALALFALLLALGQRLARNFTRPLFQLVEATQRIAAGEPARTPTPSEEELASLATAIDRMAWSIAQGRERLLREKQVVERIVDNVTSAVVSVDRDGAVVLANRLARELLGVEPGEALASALGSDPQLAPVARFAEGSRDDVRRGTARLARAAGREREWTMVWLPLAGAGDPAALLVVEDATEILRGQRLAAWAEMARIIAHEIKNPLTPIRLSAEHLREVWRADPTQAGEVVERCVANILRQVEDLRAIANEFSDYSRVPQPEFALVDLGAALAECVAAYASAGAVGATVRFERPAEAVLARIDARLLARAVRNLIENALRASAERSEVIVRLVRAAGRAEIAVEDRGPGVPSELLSRIFDPYFSTHSGGTGLGLPIARRIVEQHGGTLSASNRDGGGLCALVTIPL